MRSPLGRHFRVTVGHVDGQRGPREENQLTLKKNFNPKIIYGDIAHYDYSLWASLVAELVKNPSAMWETLVRFLGGEDPLEKGKATHSSILAWRIPWTV